MAAELRGFLVRAEDNRHGVPADRRADLVLELAVARRFFLALRTDRVDIRRSRQERRHRAGLARLLAQLREHIGGALRPLVMHDCAQCVDPFAGFTWIGVAQDTHPLSPFSASRCVDGIFLTYSPASAAAACKVAMPSFRARVIHARLPWKDADRTA